MFVEMNQKELMETEGGGLGVILLIVGILACGCLSSCSNSCDCE